MSFWVAFAVGALLGLAAYFGYRAYVSYRQSGAVRPDGCSGEPLDLVFVRGLLAHEEGAGEYRLCLGYIHQFTIEYRDAGVTIKVEYNDIRRNFSVSIWGDKAKTFLFGKCSQLAIQYVVRVAGITEDLAGRLAEREKDEREQERLKKEVIERYTQ